MYTVYLIECNTPHHVYIGYSSDLEHRIKQHKGGNGAIFTRINGVKDFKILIQVDDLKEAKKLEFKYFKEYVSKGYITGGFINKVAKRSGAGT